MRFAVPLIAATIIGFAGVAVASESASHALDTLDLCAAQENSHLVIATEHGCIRITGGVSYMFKWGDYESTGSGNSAAGTTIVRTPAEDYTVPVLR